MCGHVSIWPNCELAIRYQLHACQSLCGIACKSLICVPIICMRAICMHCFQTACLHKLLNRICISCNYVFIFILFLFEIRMLYIVIIVYVHISSYSCYRRPAGSIMPFFRDRLASPQALFMVALMFSSWGSEQIAKFSKIISEV